MTEDKLDIGGNKLHPRAGAILVNPGTGPAENSEEEHANQNIAQLVQEVGLEGMTYLRDSTEDYGEGRFAYQLSHARRDVEVQMPGWPLENVRFLGEEDQNILDFPRLYVDGSSWLWKYAVDIIKGKYEDPSDE